MRTAGDAGHGDREGVALRRYVPAALRKFRFTMAAVRHLGEWVFGLPAV